jgi:hypothetical protein
MTALIAAFVGITSALLTIFLTPHLQHYFWRRQRHAEQQLVAIGEVNKLVAEILFLLKQGSNMTDRQERLLTALRATVATVSALFSPSAFQTLQEFNLRVAKVMQSQQREQMEGQLTNDHFFVITVLYKDMGIPPPSLRRWIQEQAWQPLETWVWSRPRRYWWESCWPTFQQWQAQARTRIGRSRRHGTPGDV